MNFSGITDEQLSRYIDSQLELASDEEAKALGYAQLGNDIGFNKALRLAQAARERVEVAHKEQKRRQELSQTREQRRKQKEYEAIFGFKRGYGSY